MNPMTPRELIDAIKAVPVLQMLRRLHYRISPNQRRFGPCPECGADKEKDRDRDPHVIRTDGKGYHCYGPHGGIGCGHAGGSLELLLHHHGLDPKRMDDAAYACMRDYLGEAPQSLPERMQAPPVPEKPPLFTHAQIVGWWKLLSMLGGSYWYVHEWLEVSRGVRITDHGIAIGAASAFNHLPLERPDLREAAAAGPCAALPLYSLSTGEICNVVIRPIVPFLPPGQSKPWKAKTLNLGAGTTRDNGLPLVYGNSNAVKDPSMIVIVEGALDQITALAMSPLDVLVLGAFCADDIPLLAPWCREQTVPIVLVPHLDEMQTRCPRCRDGWAKVSKRPLLNGRCAVCSCSVEERYPGENACQALYVSSPQNIHAFNWPMLLAHFGFTTTTYRQRRSDLNDLVRRDMGDPITTIERLTPIWRSILEGMR